MISYDVTALFTSIPVDKALRVIENKLRNDHTLPQRCELNIKQIISLLAFCLNTTYFTFENNIYKQKHGATMGSSVSPVVANLYMEDFEEKAISSAPRPPHVWLRYVDDTFVVIHEYDIDSFTAHINAQDEHIKFTMERDVEGKLPFLDTEVVLNEDATINTRVYRKPTHTDQYLNWSSNHHLEHKRSVVRTLFQRADSLISTEEDRAEEIEHVKQALGANGYQKWIFNLPQKSKKQPSEIPTNFRNKRVPPIGLPYTKGLSENL